MGGTFIGVFAERGTEEIRLLPFVVVCYAVIQFFFAICTVEKSRKPTDDTAFGRSAAMLPKFPHQLKHLSVYNCRMSVREDFPFLLRSFNFGLVLKGLCCASEIDRISAVFLFGKNICYRCRTPIIRNGGRLTAIPADANPIFCRCRHLCGFEPLCDLCRSKSFNTQSKDLSDGLCRFFINNPFLCVIGIFHIPERRICCKRYTRHTLVLENVTDFLACVFSVPFVE